MEVLDMMNVRITEAREMSMKQLQAEIGKRVKKLEELGVEHNEACGFVSGIMNLGIAIQEKHDAKKSE